MFFFISHDILKESERRTILVQPLSLVQWMDIGQKQGIRFRSQKGSCSYPSWTDRQRWIVVSFHFTTPDRSMPCHIPKLRQPWCWRGLQQCLGHASLNVGIGYISNGSSSILVKIHFIRFTTSMDHRRRSQRNSKTFGTLQ